MPILRSIRLRNRALQLFSRPFHRPTEMIQSRVDEHLRQSSIDQVQATRFLSRVSWLIVIVLGALGVSMWIAPYAQSTGHRGLVAVLRIGALLEFFGLIALVVILRRRFATQVERAAATHSVLATQNEHLAKQNHELQESEGRQRALAEEASLLSRRLVEAQRVAQLGYWEIDSATGVTYWSDEMFRLAGSKSSRVRFPRSNFSRASTKPTAIGSRASQRRPSLSSPSSQSSIVSASQRFDAHCAGEGARDHRRERRAEARRDGAGRLRSRSARSAVASRAEDGRCRTTRRWRRARLQQCADRGRGIQQHAALGRKADDPDFTSIEEIRGAARRAASLTRQLLAFSRQQVLQPRLLSLNDAVNGVAKMLGRLIGEHIEVHTKLDRTLDHVRADPGQIEQVLMNLAVNARDAMINGGVLTVETANVLLDSIYASRNPGVTAGSYVMLAVTDTGTGIAPGDLDRIFEPFFTTKEAGKGTGLGLSTVHGIVEQSGGHISVYSEPGRGTSFKVYLPRAEGGASPHAVTDEERNAKAGHETILLVEDDAAVRSVAASILKRAGYSIISTENGVEALRVCQDTSSRFDLVLSDMVMPGLGGRALASHVNRIRPSTPVVLMSGYTRDAMMHSAELTDGMLFVEKPFTPDALTRKVREALDRRTSQRTTADPSLRS